MFRFWQSCRVIPVLTMFALLPLALNANKMSEGIDALLNTEGIAPENSQDGRAPLSDRAILNHLERSLENPSTLEKMYSAFKIKFGKQEGRGFTEDVDRRSIFKNRISKIANHNVLARQGTYNYQLGVNKFSDMTAEEVNLRYTGFRSDNYSTKSFSQPDSNQGLDLLKASGSRDWRTSGSVSSVKDQKDCGSCVFFASTGALESAHYIKHGGPMLDLSEQELMDCAKGYPGYGGCDGNDPRTGFAYMKDHGLSLDKDYPYKMRAGTCRANNLRHPAKVADYKWVTPHTENALKNAVDVAPVIVAIHADSIMYFKSGIFDGDCSGDLNHMVLVVGYGTDPKGIDYWIIKNSWDSNWGDKGYLYLRRNHNNLCGIATEAISVTAV